MTRVLFVCSGNACRSPMAEVFFNHMAAERGLDARAFSAGLRPFGAGATTEALRAASQYGVDLSEHEPQSMTNALAEDADLVLAMTRWHAQLVEALCPAADGKTAVLLEFIGAAGDVPDPFGGPFSVYQQCACQLWGAVEAVVQRLRAAAMSEVA